MTQFDQLTEKRPIKKVLNRNFYKFFFSFIAVIAGTLLFILVLGAGGEL